MTTPTTNAPSPRASHDKTAAATGTRSERTLTVPRLVDWLQTELGVPRLVPGVHEREMRCEQYVEDDRFVLRLELPGMDPDKDVEVTVADGVLTVRAERHESRKEGAHSEFFYGKVVRTFLLPQGAHEDEVAGTYRDGVLEITIPLPKHPPASRRTVQITRPSD